MEGRTQTLVNLISEFSVSIPTPLNESVIIKGRDVKLDYTDFLPAVTLSAIEDVFENQTPRFLGVRIRLIGGAVSRRPQMVVIIHFYKHYFESLSRILPKNAFIQIVAATNCRNETPMPETKFIKRLKISDLLRDGNQFLVKKKCGIAHIYYTHYECLFTINLGWSTPSAPKSIKSSTTALLKNLFRNESSKDFTIVAGNRAVVKCHRIILQGHGDVFAAMMSPEIGKIEMPENSEEGLQHLIRYLYGNELMPAGGLPCKVAVELFKTAHKFKLTELQASVGELLIHSGTDWYVADPVLELYSYVKNLDEFENLKRSLLKTMVKFKELTRTDPEAAAELFGKLFDMLTPRGNMYFWVCERNSSPSI